MKKNLFFSLPKKNPFESYRPTLFRPKNPQVHSSRELSICYSTVQMTDLFYFIQAMLEKLTLQ